MSAFNCPVGRLGALPYLPQEKGGNPGTEELGSGGGTEAGGSGGGDDDRLSLSGRRGGVAAAAGGGVLERIGACGGVEVRARGAEPATVGRDGLGESTRIWS